MVEDDIEPQRQDMEVALEANDRLEISKILSSINIARDARSKPIALAMSRAGRERRNPGPGASAQISAGIGSRPGTQCTFVDFD